MSKRTKKKSKESPIIVPMEEEDPIGPFSAQSIMPLEANRKSEVADCEIDVEEAQDLNDCSDNSESLFSDDSDNDESHFSDESDNHESEFSDHSISNESSFSDESETESMPEAADAVSEHAQEFLKDHPLYGTHDIRFNPKKANVVPNFIGGSLPRRDHGDREYYCVTMLTLFKPWRNGKDLKTENYSWDETFMDHTFTEHQQHLMDNFNIRYECNDARDDFSSKLKTGATSGFFPNWLSAGITDAMGDIDQNECGDDFGDGEGIDSEDYGINKYTAL